MRISLTRRAAIVAAGVLAVTVAATLPAQATNHRPAKPTIVLVHGAFADSSSWNGVIQRLRHDGYPVRAIADPLRGVAADAAYVKSYLATIDGPVVLVGHSYGGAVIGTAAAGDPDVKSLVYVAAFAPEVGESLADLSARQVAHPVPALPLVVVPTTGPGGATGAELSIDPAQFRSVFAADVDASRAADMATTQRPLDAAAFSEPSPAAAWQTIPSWYLVPRQDRAIGADLERFMAQRMGAHTVETNGSHAVMVSRPDVVTNVIEQAAR